MQLNDRFQLLPRAGSCVLALGLFACGQSKTQPEDGARFSIRAAALDLDEVEDVCYRVTVTNGPNRTGDIVWQEDLCADQFGNGAGGLAYVGSCDANVAVPNSVTLELLDIYTGQPLTPILDGTYQNPCGEIADWSIDRGVLASGEDGYGPCTIDRECVENADRPVDFDLNVMRSAGQGFIDAAVEFDDIFCSAKLDCKSEYLHHPTTGEREAAAIVAFACTAGANEETYLHVSDLWLTCQNPSGAPFVFRMDNDARTPADGQHGAVRAVGSGAPGVFNWATYQGDESLTLPSGEPLEKCYWNRAVGLDIASLEELGVTECTLSGIGTATDVPTTGLTPPIPAGTSHPIVRWSVVVYRAGTPAPTLCGNNPLNGEGSGVVSEYVTSTSDLSALPPLTDTMACGSEAIACSAGPSIAGQQDSVTVTGDGNQLEVTVGAQTTAVTLPAGYRLGSRCYSDECCTTP